MRTGRRDERDHDDAIDARALELTAAGASWLAAIAQAVDERAVSDTAGGASRLGHPARGPAGAPGRTTTTAALAPRAAPPRSLANTPAALASANTTGPQIARHATGDDVDLDAALPDVRALAGGGAPLPASLRAQLTAALGFDLDAVRVHTDGAADRAARALGAHAFAVGPDIGFRAGAFDPSTPAGLHLIAHEVAHTTQAADTAGPTRVSRPDAPTERAADTFADTFAASGPSERIDDHGGGTGRALPAGERAIQRAPASGRPSLKEQLYLAAAAWLREKTGSLLAHARSIATRLPAKTRASALAVIDAFDSVLQLVVRLGFMLVGFGVGMGDGLLGLLQGLIGLVGWLGRWWLAWWSQPFDDGAAMRRLADETWGALRRVMTGLEPMIVTWYEAFCTAPPELQSAMVGEFLGQIVVIVGAAGLGGSAGAALGGSTSVTVGAGGTLAAATTTASTAASLGNAIAGAIAGWSMMCAGTEGGGDKDGDGSSSPEDDQRPGDTDAKHKDEAELSRTDPAKPTRKGPRKIPDWSRGTPAKDLIAAGREHKGLFPDKAGPHEVLFRRDPGGMVSNYQVYDARGLPVKRVDVTGATHGGVPTPHVVEFVENVAPGKGSFVKPEKTVRPALPEEIP